MKKDKDRIIAKDKIGPPPFRPGSRQATLLEQQINRLDAGPDISDCQVGRGQNGRPGFWQRQVF